MLLCNSLATPLPLPRKHAHDSDSLNSARVWTNVYVIRCPEDYVDCCMPACAWVVTR